MKEVLTEKRYKDYQRISRYSPFPYYYNSKDNKYVYGITAQLQTNDTPFVTHTVEQGDTLDSIALYYYNNPTYYWIVTDFNRIQDPFIELVPGTKLKIPTFSAIKYDYWGDKYWLS